MTSLKTGVEPLRPVGGGCEGLVSAGKGLLDHAVGLRDRLGSWRSGAFLLTQPLCSLRHPRQKLPVLRVAPCLAVGTAHPELLAGWKNWRALWAVQRHCAGRCDVGKLHIYLHILMC